MSNRADPHVLRWSDYAHPTPLPRTNVIEVATQRRPSGSISIAVLTRDGSPPLVSLQHFNARGSAGAQTLFTLEELADLERAIALARRSA